MRRLHFTQVVDERFIKEQVQDKLCYLYQQLEEIKNNIQNKLYYFNGVSCYCGNVYKVDFGENIQLRQDFIISKTNKKTTWQDIMGIINEIKAVKYTIKKDL